MIRAACLGVVAALFAAGCGDDDEGERLRPEVTGEEPGVGVVDRDSDVAIRDFRFEPELAPIPAGASVDWKNQGDVAHTVTWRAGPGDEFDSGTIEPGKSYKRGFPAAGLIEYRCSIHPRMTGRVRVYR